MAIIGNMPLAKLVYVDSNGWSGVYFCWGRDFNDLSSSKHVIVFNDRNSCLGTSWKVLCQVEYRGVENPFASINHERLPAWSEAVKGVLLSKARDGTPFT